MRKDDWRHSQSLLHNHFQHLGFDRGEVKSTNKQDHKEKLGYVRELIHQIKILGESTVLITCSDDKFICQGKDTKGHKKICYGATRKGTEGKDNVLWFY